MTAFPQRRRAIVWGAIALALLAAQAVIVAIAPGFDYWTPWLDRPTGAYVAVTMAAGAAFLLLVPLIRVSGFNRRWFALAIAVGLAMRAGMIGTTPVFEDDFYRYLWDGAVTAHGLDPYAHAPGTAITDGPLGPVPLETLTDRQRQLVALGERSGEVIDQVNHPTVRTIYPPLAQAAFALSHWLAPWSLDGWRLVLLAAELATLGLMLALLGALGRSRLWVLLYWWNPLAVAEIMNAAHMDALLLPALTGVLLLIARGRPVAASAALAVAVAIKLWPAVLAPVVLRPLLARPRQLALAVVVFAALTAVLLAPQAVSGLGHGAGVVVYAQSWQTNAFAFPLLAAVLDWMVDIAGLPVFDVQTAARLAVAVLVGGLALAINRRPAGDGPEAAGRMLAITAALFLLSPAQYPWYLVWLLPMLVVRPSLPLLLLTVTLPLYYLRFPLAALDRSDLFDTAVVALQFAPVWGLLAWAAVAADRKEPLHAV